jgi:hypothetical protein
MGVAACVNIEQDRRYNDKTGDLDKAIRLLNEAIAFEKGGWPELDDGACKSAANILKRIGPKLLQIDPEAKL